MRTTFALLLCSLIAAAGVPRAPVPLSELTYLYRDDHDRRGVAEIVARLEGRRLSLEIRAHGRDVEAPVGYEGFRGENLQTSAELDDGLERGTIRFFTLHAEADRIETVRRGRFRIRVHDAALRRIDSRDTDAGRLRSLLYRAELGETAASRPLRMEVRVGGVPRLVLHGRQDADGGVLSRFERFRDYGPVTSALFRPLQEPPADPGTEPVEVLVRRLGDDALNVRREAARKLEARGPKVLQELERFAGDPNLEIQGAVRKVIRGIRIAEAERGLTGDDPAERARAMGRIAEVEGKEIYKLIEAAPDPKYSAALTDVVVYELSSVERGKAVTALLRIGTPKAYPALVFALRNPWNHGEPVTSWLGANGDLTVLFELERMGDKNEYAGSVAHTIRTRFPGEKSREPKEWTPIDPATFLKEISRGPTPAARIRAIRGAVNGGDRSDELLRSIGDALADPDEELRFRAAEAFSFVGAGGEEGRLEAVYRGESQSLRVRQMAAIALARMGGEAVRRRLADTLSSGPAALRITVSEALGNSADLRLVDPLTKQAALQEEPAVRDAIEKAVRQIQEAHRKRDR